MTDSPTNKAILRMRTLTGHLIAAETSGNTTSGDRFPAIEVCAKLRPHLAMLMGDTGFHALLARALSRAAVEVPSLRAVQVDASGLLIPATASPQLAAADNIEGSVALLTHLLTLLMAFIGEQLTLQILGDIWPKLQRNNTNSVKGDSA